MTLILLTGAGFSRNWGGWLASEAFEYVLGRPEVGAELRNRLWADKRKHLGFEDTLAELQRLHQNFGDARAGEMLNEFMSSLVAMFNEMNQGLASASFELQNATAYSVATFLARFDYIFTLNQDLLLEYHYLNGNVGLQSPRKFNSWQIPGLRPLHSTPHVYDPNLARSEMRTPDPANFKIVPGQQPYFKLHGSSNWVRGESQTRLLVLGGGKELEIRREPLLSWYHKEFAEAVRRPDAKLMVIGYSFGDEHINSAIGNAADLGGLSLFIVDPDGVDVLDKWKGRPGMPKPQPLRDQLSLHIRGASRRPLTSTFGHDRVEHAKLMGFVGA
jgi:hypothetical protein